MGITWAARYNTELLIKLMPKGVVFSFLFLSASPGSTHACPQPAGNLLSVCASIQLIAYSAAALLDIVRSTTGTPALLTC